MIKCSTRLSPIQNHSNSLYQLSPNENVTGRENKAGIQHVFFPCQFFGIIGVIFHCYELPRLQLQLEQKNLNHWISKRMIRDLNTLIITMYI